MKKKCRRSRREQKRRMDFDNYNLPPESFHWQEEDKLHYLMPGLPPDPEMIAEMTKSYQNNIRNSELFEMWVREFGLEKAEKLLKECKMEIKL
jgi:hypothetical protein